MNTIKHTVRKVAQDVFLIWKDIGETPLQALERLRESQQLGSEVKMTYAGRLDPLAEGELLILVGDECKNKEKYLELDKEYEVEILLGVSTDTGDVMGIVQNQATKSDLVVGRVGNVLKKYIGKITWQYPAFSSKTVHGKSLFLWALEGKIAEVEIPTRESEIYNIELIGGPTTKLNVSELREQVHGKVNSIKPVPESVESKKLGADFRREDVLQSWADFFNKCSRGPLATERAFEVIKIRCKCSSGTYMRTLAERVGEELGTPALALSIVRTKIVL